MQALRDAAVLLILGVLLVSVRITPLEPVDWIPPAQAADTTKESTAAPPERPATLDGTGDDRVFVLSIDGEAPSPSCPMRLRTRICSTTGDGRTTCETRRTAERVADVSLDCT